MKLRFGLSWFGWMTLILRSFGGLAAERGFLFYTEYPAVVTSHRNGADQERVMALGVQISFLWRAYFTPRWRSDTRIPAIKIGAHATEAVRLVETLPVGLEAGSIPWCSGPRLMAIPLPPSSRLGSRAPMNCVWPRSRAHRPR